MSIPMFPGNTAVTELEVYADAAPDGIVGGSPHLHTVSTEAYAVVAGTGMLHTVDAADGGALHSHPLAAGTVLWFSPGVIHRVENRGGLRVIAIMSNSGLPEAGDAVMTLPPDLLVDPETYERAVALPGGSHEERARAASARRDLAVEGFRMLRDDIATRGLGALTEFHSRAVALVGARAESWRARFSATDRLTELTRRQIDAVRRGSSEHLAEGTVVATSTPDHPEFGMCGLLRVPEPPAAGPVPAGSR